MSKPDYNALVSEKDSAGKTHYTKIGVAWVNSNGSIGIELKVLPLDGKIVLCTPKEDKPS